MEKQVKENWNCLFWFKKYVRYHHSFRCLITKINTEKTKFTCDGGHTITVAAIMNDLRQLPGNIDRLIDATKALGFAMHKTIKRQCQGTP